jgi:integrase
MIYQRGKGKTYWLRFRFAGRFVHESTHTTSKTIARDAERQRRRELELSINGLKERRSLPPTLEQAAVAWQQSHAHEVRPNTRRMARFALNRVLPVFGKKLLCDIDAQAVREYQKKRLAQGAQGRTINIEVGVLRQILKAHDCWTPLDGHIKMLPERKDIGRALTPEEEYRLLEVAHSLDSACYTAVVLALNTGMRHHEICGLQWQQIDFAQRALTVGRSKTAAGTGRLIPLNPTAFDALARWAGRSAEAKPEYYVFPRCENRRVDTTQPTKGWRTAWRHALRIAAIECRFHDLRHTCISKLAEGQASEQTMMAIAGHVSRRMLEHYSHIRMAAKRTALDGLKPVFQVGVHQNVHQIQGGEMEAPAKLLN